MKHLKMCLSITICTLIVSGCSSDVSKCDNKEILGKTNKKLQEYYGIKDIKMASPAEESLNKEGTIRKCSVIVDFADTVSLSKFALKAKANYIIKKTNDGEIVEVIKQN